MLPPRGRSARRGPQGRGRRDVETSEDAREGDRRPRKPLRRHLLPQGAARSYTHEHEHENGCRRHGAARRNANPPASLRRDSECGGRARIRRQKRQRGAQITKTHEGPSVRSTPCAASGDRPRALLRGRAGGGEGGGETGALVKVRPGRARRCQTHLRGRGEGGRGGTVMQERLAMVDRDCTPRGSWAPGGRFPSGCQLSRHRKIEKNASR